MRSARLVELMADPATYEPRPATVDLRETHGAWVFLAGQRAYKVKKPVRLGFLVYGTAARRRRMCREEVLLNRRLASDLYLGVRALVANGSGLRRAGPGYPTTRGSPSGRRGHRPRRLECRHATR